MIETNDNLNRKQITDLLNWFDKAINTGREVNKSASGKFDEYYVTFGDLEGDEISLLKNYLDSKNIKFYRY